MSLDELRHVSEQLRRLRKRVKELEHRRDELLCEVEGTTRVVGEAAGVSHAYVAQVRKRGLVSGRDLPSEP